MSYEGYGVAEHDGRWFVRADSGALLGSGEETRELALERLERLVASSREEGIDSDTAGR